MAEKKVIALVGPPFSGKSTLANYLSFEHDLEVFRGSAVIEAEAQKNGIMLGGRRSYDQYQKLLRNRDARYSRSFLADKALALPAERLVYDGLRNIFDALKLVQVGALIVALVCPIEVRFERATLLGKGVRVPETLEEFREEEEHEHNDPNPYGSHVELITQTMAKNPHLDTNRDLASTHQALEELVLPYLDA